ncbi:hypothetical protein ACFV6B_40985 [Streptomyces microflavus]|uniref:hypothetical protein n=1 Tax=Streptomyces microflavus TaxID=1919 RepID=UPI0036656388
MQYRRCGHAPGTISPEDQVVIDAFRSMLAALRTPEPWTPGTTHPIAVRIGAAVERARPRPGDTDGPDVIAIALEHPDGPHTPYGAAYRRLGWLRCDTAAILGTWSPAYAPLTHAASGLDLPATIGMDPAHYAVHVQAQTPGALRTLLRLGPYTQTGHATRDADRLTTLLAEQAADVPGGHLAATTTPYDPARHHLFTDPYGADPGSFLRETASRAVVRARTLGMDDHGDTAR